MDLPNHTRKYSPEEKQQILANLDLEGLFSPLLFRKRVVLLKLLMNLSHPQTAPVWSLAH